MSHSRLALAGILLAFVCTVPAAAAPVPKPASFAMCAVCHKTGAGEPAALGPNLFGVGGRKAGMEPGFTYSPAMKNSKIVWNKSSLTQFVSDPRKTVPGTRMTFIGLKDPKKADEVVTYLLSLK